MEAYQLTIDAMSSEPEQRLTRRILSNDEHLIFIGEFLKNKTPRHKSGMRGASPWGWLEFCTIALYTIQTHRIGYLVETQASYVNKGETGAILKTLQDALRILNREGN